MVSTIFLTKWLFTIIFSTIDTILTYLSKIYKIKRRKLIEMSKKCWKMTGILLEIFKKYIKISNGNKFLEEKGGVEMRIKMLRKRCWSMEQLQIRELEKKS